MGKKLEFVVDSEVLEDHVKRICRNNLKRPAKICQKCPFLGPVIDIMDHYGWKYNKEDMKEPLEWYKSILNKY